MNDPKVLGKRLKFFRERANMSQFDLENAIGASPGMISRIENGRVNPTKESVRGIGDRLNLNNKELDYLIGVTSKAPTKEEIERAIGLVKDYLDRKDVFAYIADDRWAMHAFSRGFINLLKVPEDIAKQCPGKSIIELLLDESLGIRNLFEPEKYHELLEYQLSYYYDEVHFMQDDEFVSHSIDCINKNPETFKIWEKLPNQKYHSFYPKEAREVNFKVGPFNVKTQYSREPIMRCPRFELVEYTIVGKLPRYLIKVI